MNPEQVNRGFSNFRRTWRAALAITTVALAACAPVDQTAVRSELTPRVIASKAIGSPSFAFGSGGDLELIAVIASGGRNQIRALVSHDGADTFKDLGLVAPPASDVTLSGETRPQLVMSRDELLYAVWRDDHPKPRIVVAVHDWRKPGFTTPVAVRDIESPRYSGFPDMAVGPDGSVYVVWLDGRDYDPKLGDISSVYFARSIDGGKSFERNVRVAAHTCSCCRPAIAVDAKGRTYVAWRHNFDNVRDMAVATSVDGGKTFAPLVRVSKDGWVIHGCPESGPSLLPVGNRLYIGWFTVGTDSRPRVLASWSDDQGRSFAAPVELSTGVLDANHPMLFASKPNGVWATFEGRDARTQAGWSSASDLRDPNRPASNASHCHHQVIRRPGVSVCGDARWTESVRRRIVCRARGTAARPDPAMKKASPVTLAGKNEAVVTSHDWTDGRV